MKTHPCRMNDEVKVNTCSKALAVHAFATLEKAFSQVSFFLMDSFHSLFKPGQSVRSKVNSNRKCDYAIDSALLANPSGIIISEPESSDMGRHCLCDTIRPILFLAKVFGLVPLSLQHVRKDTGLEISRDCQLVFKWRSYPVIVNTALIAFFLSILPFARLEIKDRMNAVFSGTDLYAFSFQAWIMVLETTALLTFGRIYNKKFAQGWKSLNEVFHSICDSADDLRKIKIGCYLVCIFIVVEGACILLFMYTTSYRSMGVYQNCFSLLTGTTIITLTLLIPYFVSTLFFFICLLIRSHFLKISEMLKTIVAKRGSPKLYAKIDTMRVLHEQLCCTVGHFEDFFGVQVLLTLCTCCFTITVGAYATILQGEGMSSPQGRELTGAWGMQLYCATIFLLVILISGQLVTNAAASAAPVLNSIPLTEVDEKCQQQIMAFLYKVSAFPTTMKALNITSISTTFLASATTNIITYLLVLMQFKLSFETWYGNLTNDTDNAGLESAMPAEPSSVVSNAKPEE